MKDNNKIPAKVNKVCFNDIVDLKIKFPDEEDPVYETYMLVDRNPDFFADITEISIDSELGHAIYDKEIGEDIVYKSPEDDKDIFVSILNIEKQKIKRMTL